MALAKIKHTLVHTGQHFDDQMSGVFFEELKIRAPDVQLSTEGTSHAQMTADLLVKLEKLYQDISPKSVLVVGDTTSTLSAVLAAVKMQIPVAHLEAGPRLGDLLTPEESNRIVADHLSTLCFAPDQSSMDNLAREGLFARSVLTGDVMLDAYQQYKDSAIDRSALLRNPKLLGRRNWIYITLHRPFNVDHRECHERLIAEIRKSRDLFVFPAHARTQHRIAAFGLAEEYQRLDNLVLTPPLGYFDSLAAIQRSRLVVTDSGGVQKEAYFAGRKSLLLLNKTPWPSLKDSGWQHCADSIDRIDLLDAIAEIDALPIPELAPSFFGNGNATEIVIEQLKANRLL